MAKTKVVHVISSLKMGGAESLLVDFLRVSQADGYEHHVIFFHDGPNKQRIEDLGIKTYHIAGLFCMYDPLFWWRFFCLLKKLKPDIIHSSLWAANFASRLIGVWLQTPTLCVIHAQSQHEGRFRNIVDRYSFGLATKIVTVSKDVKESFSGAILTEDSQRMITIKNGIDYANIVQQNEAYHISRSDLGLSDKHFIIGSVGRFVEVKNYSQLIRVFARFVCMYPNARLLLIGFGQLEAEYRRHIKQLGITDKVVFIVGQKPYGYYSLMDCFVSSSFQEGLSIALLEAMSSSLPCVITYNGIHHEVINHGRSGYLVPVNDDKALLGALMRCIKEQNVCSSISAQASMVVKENFDIRDMVRNYYKIYDQMLTINNK